MFTRLPSHRWFAVVWLGLLLPVAADAAARQVPLIEAVKSGDVAAVRALLPQADVNAAQGDGTTALHWAVHLDNATLVDLLIKSGATVQVANRYKMTPLGLAAINGNAGVIGRLLKAGADANDTIAEGETALMTAARSDRVDVVKMLLAHGAKVNARETFRGQTALMWAAARGNIAVVRTLLEAGADVRAKAPTVVRVDSNLAADFLDADYIGGQTGWQFRMPAPSAFSALTFAVREGHMDVVGTLLDGGANVDDVLSDGTSALVLAAANYHFELVAFLLDRGADPNANEQGWTVLHQVVRQRRTNTRSFTAPVPTGAMDAIDLIKELIAQGAHVNARVWNNRMQRKDLQRERLNYMGATPFLVAAKIGDVEVMRLLLENGADPHITNVENETALMVAAGVALFNPGEDAGSSPQHMAGRLAAVKLCVEELGQDVNALSTDNETALHGAVYLGDIPVIEYLVEQGAKLDVKNERGWTPLNIANGVAYAEFFKEYPEVAVVLNRLMTERGLSVENQAGDQVTCKNCNLTRGEEAYRTVTRDRELQADTALVAELKNAK